MVVLEMVVEATAKVLKVAAVMAGAMKAVLVATAAVEEERSEDAGRVAVEKAVAALEMVVAVDWALEAGATEAAVAMVRVSP